jgi:hypothetical protein
MAESDSPQTETPSQERSVKRTRVLRSRLHKARAAHALRTLLPIEEAAVWFVADLLEVSGYARPWTRHRSGYAHYRPILTAPDPWYFAGLVALETSKIIDVFPKKKADALLREVLIQADLAGARHEVRVSNLVLGVMGRLGMGAILLQAKVPDILISKVMRLLLGSHRSARRLIPSETAHEQVTSALKLGPPVWWRMFVRVYDIRLGDEVEDSGPLRPIPPDTSAEDAVHESPGEDIAEPPADGVTSDAPRSD